MRASDQAAPRRARRPHRQKYSAPNVSHLYQIIAKAQAERVTLWDIVRHWGSRGWGGNRMIGAGLFRRGKGIWQS